MAIDTVELAKYIRLSVIHMTSSGRSSHVGSCLSVADILAVLYGKIMKHFPSEPLHSERDRMVMSKGHAGAAVYATLAHCGYMSTDILKTHYQNGSLLSGHVSHKGVPGVEISTGSLGHGLPLGVGIAYGLGAQIGQPNVYVVMSDGECDEGSNWEAALFAAHHRISNITAIIDHNKLQSLDTVDNTLRLSPFADKWRAFNWNVLEVNGHDHNALMNAFNDAKQFTHGPTCIIAHTVKGYGVSFMQNSVLWHYRSPQGDEYKLAIEEVENRK